MSYSLMNMPPSTTGKEEAALCPSGTEKTEKMGKSKKVGKSKKIGTRPTELSTELPVQKYLEAVGDMYINRLRTQNDEQLASIEAEYLTQRTALLAMAEQMQQKMKTIAPAKMKTEMQSQMHYTKN